MDYTTPELLNVAGLSKATFDQWVYRGLIDLSSGEPGPGNYRRHTPHDVMQVAVLAELARLGISPSRGRTVWQEAAAPNLRQPLGTGCTILVPPDGSGPTTRAVYDDADWRLHLPGAPTALVVLRAAALEARICAKLAELRP